LLPASAVDVVVVSVMQRTASLMAPIGAQFLGGFLVVVVVFLAAVDFLNRLRTDRTPGG
jgi:hypothetical protein